MITNTDWDDALDAWAAEERERLGGPPSPEEVLAYVNGELTGAAAVRIRTLLVCYPELTPLLDERIEPPRRMRFGTRPLYALAATLAIGFMTTTTLWLQERSASSTPAVHSSRHELSAFSVRGGADKAAYELPAGQERYLLIVSPSSTPVEDAYTLEIRRNGKLLWSDSEVRPVDDTFSIDVPGRFLGPGTYTLHVYTRDKQLIDSYTIRTSAR